MLMQACFMGVALPWHGAAGICQLPGWTSCLGSKMAWVLIRGMNLTFSLMALSRSWRRHRCSAREREQRQIPARGCSCMLC